MDMNMQETQFISFLAELIERYGVEVLEDVEKVNNND